MNFLKPAQARETMPCPLARTFAEKKGPNCMADKCPVWRWKPLDASDPVFSSAIKREIACLSQESGKAANFFHKQAVANVMKNPEGYGVDLSSKVGWCGLGGEPRS